MATHPSDLNRASDSNHQSDSTRPPDSTPPSVSSLPPAHRGRGAREGPPNRFERLHMVRSPDSLAEDPNPKTQFFKDSSRRILATNNSPDIGFDFSINPYRGCEHGCAYCYARPTHEYLGYGAGLDFETKILVKYNAPELLREQLSARRWVPQVIAMSGVTDPYQPVEKRLQITRGCLEVLAEFRNPVAMITKNHLVTRDVDLLSVLAGYGAASVTVSVTSLKRELQRELEPRTSTPKRRLDAIRTLTAAGIPVRVNVAPIIPGLNDEEIPAILEAAAEAGATSAGRIMLRLPGAVAPLFDDWLQRVVPDRRDKVMNRLAEMRGGRANDPRFRTRMRGEGVWADQMHQVFEVAARRFGLDTPIPVLSTRHFRIPGSVEQVELF